MSKHRVAVLKVVSAQLSVTAAAAEYGFGRQTSPAPAPPLPRGRARGPRAALPTAAQQPRSDAGGRCASGSSPCAPSSPPAGSMRARSRSPGTSSARALPVPSTSTIRRVLHAAGLVVPEPRKRPRSSWLRFEARPPTSCGSPTSPTGAWRTGPRSRSARGSMTTPATCSAARPFERVDGDDVVATFCTAGEAHGWPAATLTDNGAVYTSRFTGGRNGFEHLLAYLGIRQKNGAPGHPQTQGKVERFHQTLKRWLGQQPAARTLAELQAQLDAFRLAYDEERPHRAIGRVTPGEAYRARPKAHPAGRGAPGHFRLRYDVADGKGSITLRRAGRLHHLGDRSRPRPSARPRHRRRARGHRRRPRHGRGPLHPPHRARDGRYWRDQRRDPGRWPGSRATE